MSKETDKKKTTAKAADKKPAKAAEKKTTAKKADDKKAAKTAEKKAAEKKPAAKTAEKKATAKTAEKKVAEKKATAKTAEKKVAEKKPAAKKADTSKLDALIKAAVADGKITDAERKVLEKRAKEEGFDKDELSMLLDASLYEKKDVEKKKKEPAAEKKSGKSKDPFEGLMVNVKGGEYIHYWTTPYEYQPKDKRKKPVKPTKLDSKTIKIDNFKICKYPVTQALWKKVMGEDNNPSFFRGDNLPVDSVSRELVNLFLNKLNKLTGKKYRLPMINESIWAATGSQLSEFGSAYAGEYWYEKTGDRQLEEYGRMIYQKQLHLDECLKMFSISNKKGLPISPGDRNSKLIPPSPIGSYKNKIGIYDLASVYELCDPIKDGDVGSYTFQTDYLLCGTTHPGVTWINWFTSEYRQQKLPRVLGFRIAL